MGEATAGVTTGNATDTADRPWIILDEVLAGLSQEPKRLSPKFFYDNRGSELFERITRLEEYYPTRTERALLERWAPEWVRELRPAALVELGAGSAEKSRIILDRMAAVRDGALYVPIDVSGEFLHEAARRLRDEYPGLRVAPAVADMTDPIEMEVELPEPTWIAILGSTIGNFEGAAAVDLLRRVADRLRGDDRLLMGADLRPGPNKSVERLELAYNDAEGVTAEFNLNVLRVLNRELDADFDLEAFRHLAFYDQRRGRIELHLVSLRDQVVRFGDGGEVRLATGESIQTELSCKYDRPSVEELFGCVGLAIDRWVEDPLGYFALVMGRPA